MKLKRSEYRPRERMECGPVRGQESGPVKDQGAKAHQVALSGPEAECI